MKIAGPVILAAVGMCLAPYGAMAAGTYDGSVPLLCVPLVVNECAAGAECRRVTAESVDLPQFLKVDLKAMTVRAEETGRQSPVASVERLNGKLIIHGSQGERAYGWTMTVSESTGKMSATIATDEEGFVVFGACTVP